MENFKHWLTSKTVIAAALGVIITVLQVLGVDQAAGIDKDSLSQHIVDIVEGGLYLVALYGRLTAKAVLTT
jgi:hypothetical protein